jgi:hypothetical protein
MFYTIIFNVIFTQDAEILIKFFKITFILIISVIFIILYKNITYSKLISILLIYGLISSFLKINQFLIIAMPIMMGVILSRINLNVFLNYFIKYSFISAIIIFIIYLMFFNKFQANDYLSIRPDIMGNVTNFISRKTFVFKSPNNIGLFINILALIAIVQNKNKLFATLFAFSFLCFFYTNSRGSLLVIVLFGFINISKQYIYKYKKQSIIMMLILTFIPLLLIECLDKKLFTIIDNISSNRLHYIDILFKFNIFPNINGYTLDSSFISLLNIQGLIITLCFIYILYKTSIISDQSIILSIGLLLIGLFENIINQYIILMPLIYSIYLCKCKEDLTSCKNYIR